MFQLFGLKGTRVSVCVCVVLKTSLHYWQWAFFLSAKFNQNIANVAAPLLQIIVIVFIILLEVREGSWLFKRIWNWKGMFERCFFVLFSVSSIKNTTRPNVDYSIFILYLYIHCDTKSHLVCLIIWIWSSGKNMLSAEVWFITMLFWKALEWSVSYNIWPRDFLPRGILNLNLA